MKKEQLRAEQSSERSLMISSLFSLALRCDRIALLNLISLNSKPFNVFNGRIRSIQRTSFKRGLQSIRLSQRRWFRWFRWWISTTYISIQQSATSLKFLPSRESFLWRRKSTYWWSSSCQLSIRFDLLQLFGSKSTGMGKYSICYD